MNRSNPRLTPVWSAVVLFIAVVVVAFATGGFGRVTDAGQPSTPPPSATPSPTPTSAPSDDPSPRPSVKPSPSPSDDEGPIPGDVTVDLDDPTGHDVTSIVRDDSGDVVEVRSGKPGDGMSVKWHDIAVDQIDARTVKVTWVGIAIDEQVFVNVSADRGGYLVEIVQAGPRPNSDALGADRVLVLTFDRPVRAADVNGGVADRTIP